MANQLSMANFQAIAALHRSGHSNRHFARSPSLTPIRKLLQATLDRRGRDELRTSSLEWRYWFRFVPGDKLSFAAD